MDLTVRVSNPSGVATGVASVSVDRVAVSLNNGPADAGDGKRGALVPVGVLKDGAVVDVVMG